MLSAGGCGAQAKRNVCTRVQQRQRWLWQVIVVVPAAATAEHRQQQQLVVETVAARRWEGRCEGQGSVRGESVRGAGQGKGRRRAKGGAVRSARWCNCGARGGVGSWKVAHQSHSDARVPRGGHSAQELARLAGKHWAAEDLQPPLAPRRRRRAGRRRGPGLDCVWGGGGVRWAA